MILCYHGVSLDDEHEWRPALYMSAEALRGRLELLRAGRYNVLPLGEAVRRLYDGTLPPRAVALTFDDGAIDFAERAVPLLREFGMPATVYLTTYYCDHRHPVFGVALTYLLWKGRASGADVADLAGHPGPLAVGSDGERGAAWSALAAHAERCARTDDERTALLRHVAARIGVDFDAVFGRGVLQIMPPGMIRALPRDLIDVQLHTHRHRTPRAEDEFRREIAENRERIVALAGDSASPPVHFCYPSGDYSAAFLPWLRREGVESATTCLPALATRADEPLLLPRFVDAHSQPLPVFEAWISGFAQLLPQRGTYQLDSRRA